jgi:hypothetical protein
MIFNFAMLALAGISTGFMVYQLTGNYIGGLLSMPIITLGTGSTMHLFYSGTIFNIVGVLIFIPLAITLGHYLFKNNKWILMVILAIPIMVFTYLWHPALGEGLFIGGKLRESILNPVESILLFYGIFNAILLAVSITLMVKGKMFISKYNVAWVSIFSVVVIVSAVIGYFGLNPFPSRVIINMVLILSLLTVLIMAMALNTPSKIGQKVIIGLATISCLPGLFSWVSNSIIRGVSASAILS